MRRLLAFWLLFATGHAAAVDLVVVNGRIWTGDAAQPEAAAMAIDDGRIVAIGDNARILALVDPATQRIDLHGHRVVPGINDAHMHLGGRRPGTELALPATGNPPDPDAGAILAALRAQPADEDGWLVGTIGPSAWADPRLRIAQLDTIQPQRPVWLSSYTGHGTLVNSAARRALHIDPDVPIPGGWFGHGSDGGFDGRLFEYAQWRPRFLHWAASDADTGAAIRAYSARALALGITSIQNIILGDTPERFITQWQATGTPLRLRLVLSPVTIAPGQTPPGATLAAKPAAERVRVSGSKWIIDGTPVERDAAMREAYPGTKTAGRLNFSRIEIQHLLREALARGDQPILHASGDEAIAAVFDAMHAIAPVEDWRAKRVRIEHGDGLAPDLLARAATLGIVLVQNPAHLQDSAIQDVIRARDLQPLADVLDHGIPLAIGSDGPEHPWLNLMWATRHGNRPAQALSRVQALQAYTAGSAYAEFEEHRKGRLAPGQLADFAVLSQDVLDPQAVPDAALPATRSLLTVIGGEIAWRDPAFAPSP